MTHRDDAGNVQVDFVWGNFPLQPNDDRGELTLDPALDNHVIATDGWSNFPGFIPNYSGDEDSGLETVVPNVRGLQRIAAQEALLAANLDYDRTYVSPVMTAFSNVGNVATVTLDDAYYFVAGDVISGFYSDDNEISGNFTGKITNVTGVDGEILTITLNTAIDPDIDIDTLGSYLYDNYTGSDTRYVLRQGTSAGSIVNEGTVVDIFVIQNND